MDFHGMKRKVLQGLCKKHGVPANLTNREMADRLTSIFKENEDPVSLEESSSIPEEICSENEAKIVKKQLKKVRFSSDNETIEYEVSVYQQRRGRSRRQTLSKNPAQVLENVPDSEDSRNSEGCQVRVTRSRVQNAVEEAVHMAPSPPVGRKRGRVGKKGKDAEEVVSDSEGLELGQKEDVKNGHDKVTGGLRGRQLRSRKNVSQEGSKKIRDGKEGDEVHLLDDNSEGKNGPKQQSTRNSRKGDQSVAFSSEVEKVEVGSRVTRQSSAQSKDVASMVEKEVKIVGIKEGYEAEKPVRRSKRNSEKDFATSVKSDTQVTEVREHSEKDNALVEHPECSRRYSSRRKAVVSQSGKGGNKEEFLKEETRKRSRSAELEAIVEESSEVEKVKCVVTSQQQAPSRRSRRKTVALTAPAADLAPAVGKGSTEELDAIIEDSSEVEGAKYAATSQQEAHSRRSRRKTVALTDLASDLASVGGKGSTEELDAIVEDSSEVERAKYAATSQQAAPSRRGRRKTVVLTAPAVDLVNKEDIGRTEQLEAPVVGKGTTEELDAIVEDSSEVERAKYAATSQQEAPSRRGRRKTVVLTAPAADLANKEDIGRTEQLEAPLVGKGTTEELDAIVEDSSEVERAKGALSSQQEAPLRRNRRKTVILTAPVADLANKEDIGRTEQLEAPLVGTTEELDAIVEDSSEVERAKGALSSQQDAPSRRNRRKTVILTAPAADLANKEDTEQLKAPLQGKGTTEELDAIVQDRSEVERAKSAITSEHQSPLRKNRRKTVILTAPAAELPIREDISRMEQLRSPHLEKVSTEEIPRKSSRNSSRHSIPGTSKEDQIAVAENDDQGVKQQTQERNQEEEKTSVLKHHAVTQKPQRSSSLITSTSASVTPPNQTAEGIEKKLPSKSGMVIVEEEAAIVESLPSPGELSEDAGNRNNLDLDVSKQVVKNGDACSNWVKPLPVEFESNVINMDSSDAPPIAGLPFGVKRDLIGATSTFLHSEKELTVLPGGENTNFESDVSADDSRIPFGEAQIRDKLKADVINLNKFGESSGRKSEQEDCVTQAEEMIATDVSNTEGIPYIVSSVEAAENQVSSAQSHFATAETDAQKIFDIQQSTYSNIVAPGTPSGPAPGNQFEGKCQAEAADTAGKEMSYQERSEDPDAGNEPCVHESVLMYEENNELVKNDEEIRIHDGSFESNSSPSLNRTGAVDNSNLVESRMVDFESSGSKMVCPEITSLADIFSSGGQEDHAGKPSRIEVENLLETRELSETQELSENMNINYNMDAEGMRTPVAEDQIKGKLENANTIIADSVEEVIFNDLLNELGQSIGLKSESEIPLEMSEQLSASKFSDGQGIILSESSVKTEKQEHRAHIDVVASITGTPSTTEMKCRSSSDSATHGTPVGLAPRSQDKLCSAGNTVSIVGSEIFNHDMESGLMEDDKEKLLQDDTIEGEIKNQPFMSLNKTGSLDDACVEVASNANKVVSSAMTYIADVYSSANQTNFAGETSNELKPEKLFDLEEPSRIENVNYTTDKFEVKEDTSLSQEDQGSMHLEDTDITTAEPVQQVVSLKNEEETGTDSSGIGMIQTENSVEINEMSEAVSQKAITERQWSLSNLDKDLISPPRPQEGSQDVKGKPDVSNAGYAIPGQLNNEGVKIVENEEAINTETELFVSAKKIIDQSSEGEFRENGIYDPISESIDSETHEKHLCEAFYGGRTGPVSPEEKRNDILNSASKGISEKKSPFNSCLRVTDDMQENSEAACMDNKNMRDEIPANIFQQPAATLEESEAAKQGAESEVNAIAFSNGSQALPPEELTAPITSESFSMTPLDHSLVDGERIANGERVMDLPFVKDFTATMDGNGISARGETDAVKENNIVEEMATSALKVELTDCSGGNVDAEFYDTNMSVTETIIQETDTFGVASTEYLEEMSNAPSAMGSDNSRDLDDPSDKVGLERDCGFSSGVDCLKSTAGIIVDNISVVGTLESTLKSNDLQSGIEVDDPNISAAKQLDAIFTIEEAGVGDGEKASVSHLGFLHGGEQEDVSSFADTPCSKLEIRTEKEHSQAMDDINNVGGTEISTECKVTREERDWCHINAAGFNDVTDGSFVEGSKIDLEEIAEAKSDDCESSMKTDAALDRIDGLDVNQSPCLDERKSCDLETEEPHGLHFPENIAVDSMEVGTKSCSKLDIMTSVKPEMVVDCSSVSSVCVVSDERKHLENSDESNIFTCMEMSLFLGVEDGVKTPVAMAGDSKYDNLDKAIPECNSSDFEEGDYDMRRDVDDTNFSVEKDGPEDTEETMELRNDFYGQDAIIAAKSPLSKNSEISRESKYLANPDEPNIFTNVEMSLFLGVQYEVKKSDANAGDGAGDGNDVALDKAITECNSSDTKEGDFVARTDVEDTNFSVKNYSPEDTEGTVKDFSGQDAAMADKSSLSKHSEISRECEDLANPDESNIFTNMEMSLFLGVGDEVKNSDAKAGDSNDVTLDKAIPECNSSDFEEGDHVTRTDVEDTTFAVKEDGPEETMELRNDFYGQDAAIAERKDLANPDESNIFTNTEMSLFWGVEDEVKNSDVKAGESNDVPLDKAISECNSSDFKEGNHVEDANFSVVKDGPEDNEATIELRKDILVEDAAVADKSPLPKKSEIRKVVDGEEAAFRTELKLLNASAKKESNSVSVKQLISSIMKSKSKPVFTQRTPKRPIFHDMKENEGSTKRARIGNMTTPKTSSKLRRPLERILD
ncbi:hypothetical protein ERO13_A05G244401v2 [Gossypium hirsutum]|uniref:Uncharacterized protein isoform X2 n=1 Tax=Gossypium hirsutum TaxID=3635 RepID=A0A1U8K764_GOSHI|nr:uncharacterized protein LOC107914098 isoform X2 [Gossypium hirsutum]KAG4200921.1 hypothetical protein ERO13_A05G244401v2 [Gossypium hirsutum]